MSTHPEDSRIPRNAIEVSNNMFAGSFQQVALKLNSAVMPVSSFQLSVEERDKLN